MQLNALLFPKEALGAEHSTGRALIALAGAVAELGEDDRALHLAHESVEIFSRLGDKHSCVELLEVLASLYAKMGQSAGAARIFGALDSLRTSISIPIEPHRKAKHELSIALSRDTLSAIDFRAAWTVGKATSLEEIVLYALLDGSQAAHPDSYISKLEIASY